MKTMNWKTGAAGLAACSMLLGAAAPVWGMDALMNQAQQMYGEAYDQAMEEYNEAYDQAMDEYNEALGQAQDEVNKALGAENDEASGSDETDPPVTEKIKDYVGRNLASIGYQGLDGNWHDQYCGTFSTVDLVIITDDGSYIEPDDKDMQKQYVVTSQNPEPNTENDFVLDDYGFVDSQTYSEIELHVAKIQ